MKSFSILAGVILISAVTALAFPTWVKTYSYGPILHLVPLSNGHTVFAARSGNQTTVVEVDENGDVVWESQITGVLYGFAELPSSDYMVMYKTGGVVTLTGISAAGAQTWTNPAPEETDIQMLVPTSDGCVTYHTGDDLVKLNPDGSTLWIQSTADSLDNVTVINRAPGVPGGVVLGGTYNSMGGQYLQAGVADASGAVLWTAYDYQLYAEEADAIDVFGASDGTCYAAGDFSSSFPPPQNTQGTFRFDGGDTDWKKTTRRISCICESPEGDAVIAGRKDVVGTYDVFIQKLSAQSGGSLWFRTHGFTGTAESANCIALCADSGYVIGGFTSPLSLLIKTDSEGLVNGMGIEGADPTPIALGAPYPNPASASVSIPLGFPDQSPVSIRILDLAGRTVATLGADQFAAGQHTLNWDLTDSNGSQVSDGIYSVVVSCGELVLNERIVVIR